MSLQQGQHTAGTLKVALWTSLARQIARWNSSYRESWLVNEWQPKHGKESTDRLRIAAHDARTVLIAEREEKRLKDREAGREAIKQLRSKY